MAVKYHCRKCGKRFVEWGAQKLDFRCPDCETEELVRMGSSEDKAPKRPTLKRRVRRPAAEEAEGKEEALLADTEETEEVETDEVLFEAGEPGMDYEETVSVGDTEDTDSGEPELGDELGFGTVTPPLGDEIIDESLGEKEEWE